MTDVSPPRFNLVVQVKLITSNKPFYQPMLAVWSLYNNQVAHITITHKICIYIYTFNGSSTPESSQMFFRFSFPKKGTTALQKDFSTTSGSQDLGGKIARRRRPNSRNKALPSIPSVNSCWITACPEGPQMGTLDKTSSAALCHKNAAAALEGKNGPLRRRRSEIGSEILRYGRKFHQGRRGALHARHPWRWALFFSWSLDV